jgi:hypothetical protein
MPLDYVAKGHNGGNMDERHDFHAGEVWSYRAPSGFEGSRIVIGAVLSYPDQRAIVCCAVSDAPRKNADGSISAGTIPFLPMWGEALAASVVACEGAGELPPEFAPALDAWSRDERGLAAFSVPFEGRLDLLIARQMQEIAGSAGRA